MGESVGGGVGSWEDDDEDDDELLLLQTLGAFPLPVKQHRTRMCNRNRCTSVSTPVAIPLISCRPHLPWFVRFLHNQSLPSINCVVFLCAFPQIASESFLPSFGFERVGWNPCMLFHKFRRSCLSWIVEVSKHKN
jgi:hypothetical protein